MKKEFYFVKEQNLFIRLSEVTSFKLEGGFKNTPDNLKQCCIVVKPNSVFWCDKSHYNILIDLLFSSF
jgi:hypothetical protein